ncbi:acetyl-CoA carboxylase, biotin carboxyl carrier protein [Peptoniphilus sp. ING2-D1G]|nr:acetyl-CoA carboxylase, biotin carboxyl carrier protein [Peptoniphilus sp. ING2-D1G]
MEKFFEITEKLVKLFENSQCSSFNVSFEDFSLDLKKEASEVVQRAQVAENKGQKEEVEDNLVNIKAPIVGVFYSASSPGEKNLALVGDYVKKGDTLCILESMKIMNEIKSPCDGIVVEICCENEDFVEYDQVLMKIEKNSE